MDDFIMGGLYKDNGMTPGCLLSGFFPDDSLFLMSVCIRVTWGSVLLS